MKTDPKLLVSSALAVLALASCGKVERSYETGNQKKEREVLQIDQGDLQIEGVPSGAPAGEKTATGAQPLEVEGEIVQVDGEDPGMNRAMAEARKTFPQFWKEIQADRKRPLPVLESPMVKGYFTDRGKNDEGEHMWVSEIRYDGKMISGTLESSPGSLRSVQRGDQVSFPLERVSDWLYVHDGKANGAYTIKFIRDNLSEKDREAHDANYPFSFD